jgi:hypothetical protein
MKQFLVAILLISITGTALAQKKGYQITVDIKPLKRTWVYMGYYYGKMMPISDSTFLDDKGRGVFKASHCHKAYTL